MERVIQTYKSQASETQRKLHENHKAISRLVRKKNLLIENHNAKSFWDKFLSAFSYYKQSNSVEEELYVKKHEQMRLNKEQSAQKRTFLNAYIPQSIKDQTLLNGLQQLKSAYNVASKLSASAKHTFDLANIALREIDDADSAVSNAQVFELADMVTSSKGTSLISTVITSSASSEIDDASRAIEKLKNALGAHHKLASNINSPMSLEYVDLAIDLSGLDLGLDLTSVMSFFSLSSTSSDLSSASMQIKKILPNLKSHLASATQASDAISLQLKTFLKEAYKPALDELLSVGIEVTESEFKSMIDSTIHSGGL